MKIYQKYCIALCFAIALPLQASQINQTADLSPIAINPPLPFRIVIETESYMVPGGIQSAAWGDYQGQYIIIAGRTSGLHGFDSINPNSNFPPDQQNTMVFVVNSNSKKVMYRSLNDPLSGLTQAQIDALSVTAPQFCQNDTTMYITGGYGIDTVSGNFTTKATLTAIDMPGLISWVTKPYSSNLASNYIRQITNPIFRVTGGAMYLSGDSALLIFGQDFEGPYTPSSTGIYTEQVRVFKILDDGENLGVVVQNSTNPNPNYRRRDLNVVPFIKIVNSHQAPGFIAYSGVFTEAGGIWTVPVEISANGGPTMADPSLPSAFKQGMNNYICAHVPILARNGTMYTVLFGGITYEYFQDGQFLTDPGFPFTDQVTVVSRSINGVYQQGLLPVEYPVIFSTASNPGSRLLFGAGAKFMPAFGVPFFANGVLDLSGIKESRVIGYIIGGIQSTLPDTQFPSDSAASPYIFRVTLTPQ